MLSQLLTPQGMTLAAAIECFLAPRLVPQLLETRSHLAAMGAIFALNYAVLGLYYLVIYPFLLSPLRHLPGPRTDMTLVPRAMLTRGTSRAPGDLYLDIINAHKGPDELLLLNVFKDEVLITGGGGGGSSSTPRALADLLVHRAYDFAKPPKAAQFLAEVLGADSLIVVEGDRHRTLRRSSLPAFGFRHIRDLYPMMWARAREMGQGLRRETEVVVVNNDNNNSNNNNDCSSSTTTATTTTTTIVEINNWASRATLDIIGDAGLGRSFGMLSHATDPLLAAYEELLEPTREKLLFFVASALLGLGRVSVLFPWWGMNATFRRIVASLEEICRPLMREKREALAMVEGKDDDDDDTVGMKEKSSSSKKNNNFDVLSLLVRSGHFTDRQLTDQLLTYLAAGHETTSSALTWACYLLGKDRDTQERLRQEVRAAMPASFVVEPLSSSPSSSSSSPSCANEKCDDDDDDEAPPVDDDDDLATTLESLPLLNGVINETLRLYPTVPITMREAVRDTSLGDQFVPRGTRVVVCPWAVNRSPGIWGADAAEFRPGRWITVDDEDGDGDDGNRNVDNGKGGGRRRRRPTKEQGRPNTTGGVGSNYHFLTFLHGPRSCIGQGFARAELRCLLAALVGGFEWGLADDRDDLVVPGGVITMKPMDGMYLKLRPLAQVR